MRALSTYFKLTKKVSTFGFRAPAMAKFALPVSTRTLNWKKENHGHNITVRKNGILQNHYDAQPLHNFIFIMDQIHS
jgi:hypothetical protein